MDLAKCKLCLHHRCCRSETLIIIILQEFEGIISDFSFSCFETDKKQTTQVIVSPCENCKKRFDSCHIRRSLVNLTTRRHGAVAKFLFKCKFFVEDETEPVQIISTINPDGEKIHFKIPKRKLKSGYVWQWPELPQ